MCTCMQIKYEKGVEVNNEKVSNNKLQFVKELSSSFDRTQKTE